MAYIRCDEELHALVKIEAVRARMGMGELISRAVKHYLACLVKPRVAGKTLSGPHAELVQKLIAVLDSGDTDVINAVTANVEVFFDRRIPKPPA